MIDPVGAWGAELVRLEQQIAFLELQAARLAAELADDTPEGFVNMVDWLRFNCHLTSTVAADRINVGRHLGQMQETVEAMCKGRIGYAHVKVMARTAEAVGKRFDEDRLLPLALDNSPGKFHFKCLHYRHAVDRAGFDREQDQLHERRGLRLSTAEDGCLLISGALDPVGGAVVRNTLESLARPCGAADKRTREQRLADALVELAESKVDVQLQVTSSVETLLGLCGAPGAENEFSLPTPDFLSDGGALGLRLEPVADPAPGLGRDRRRALRADDQGSTAEGADRPRPALPLARLRAAWFVVRRAPHRALGERRRGRDRKPGPALPAASPAGPRRRLAADQDRRRRARHHRAGGEVWATAWP